MDLAAMPPDHDAPGDVEAEPGAPADLLRREERLEDAGPDLARHPGPRVADLDHHAVIAHAPGPHREGAAATHGIDGVVDEVGPHLVELCRIGDERREAAVVVADDL